MQSNAIQLSQQPKVVVLPDVRESLIAMRSAADGWLDSVSPFFTRISGMQVTRRVVVRMYALLVCLIALVVCLQQAFVVSLVMAVASVWLTVRINHFANVNKKVGEG